MRFYGSCVSILSDSLAQFYWKKTKLKFDTAIILKNVKQ